MTELETPLETQVRSALRRAEEQAPSAHGLADAVRARREGARRTRAWGVSGLVAAVVALVLVLPAVLGGGPDADPPATGDAEEVWRTVTLDYEPGSTQGAVEVDVPDDWRPGSPRACALYDRPWGPVGGSSCAGAEHVGLVTAVVDRAELPGVIVRTGGLWVGYVDAGASEVGVGATDLDTARRILASARPAGEAGPDVTGWTTEPVGQGVMVDVPADTGVRVEVPPGVPFCARERSVAERGQDEGWVAGLCRDVSVTVTAPTQALADVVAATVRGY